MWDGGLAAMGSLHLVTLVLLRRNTPAGKTRRRECQCRVNVSAA